MSLKQKLVFLLADFISEDNNKKVNSSSRANPSLLGLLDEPTNVKNAFNINDKLPNKGRLRDGQHVLLVPGTYDYHNDEDTLRSNKKEICDFGKIEALSGCPVLSCPIDILDEGMESLYAAGADIWKAIGAGLIPVLPVRPYQSKMGLTAVFSEPLNGTKTEDSVGLEPNFWDVHNNHFNREVSEFYLVLFNQIQLFLKKDIGINDLPYLFQQAYLSGKELAEKGENDWRLHDSKKFIPKKNKLTNKYKKEFNILKSEEEKIKFLKMIFLNQLNNIYFTFKKIIPNSDDDQEEVRETYNVSSTDQTLEHSKNLTANAIAEVKTTRLDDLIEILKAEHRAIVESRRLGGIRHFFKSGGSDSEMAKALECCLNIAGVEVNRVQPDFHEEEISSDIRGRQQARVSLFTLWKRRSAHYLLRYIDARERSFYYKFSASHQKQYENRIKAARNLSYELFQCDNIKDAELVINKFLLHWKVELKENNSKLLEVVNKIEHQLIGVDYKNDIDVNYVNRHHEYKKYIPQTNEAKSRKILADSMSSSPSPSPSSSPTSRKRTASNPSSRNRAVSITRVHLPVIPEDSDSIDLERTARVSDEKEILKSAVEFVNYHYYSVPIKETIDRFQLPWEQSLKRLENNGENIFYIRSQYGISNAVSIMEIGDQINAAYMENFPNEYSKYNESLVMISKNIEIDPTKLLILLRVTSLFYYSGMKIAGSDSWKNDSANNLFAYLTNHLHYRPQVAKIFADIIRYKDDKNRYNLLHKNVHPYIDYLRQITSISVDIEKYCNCNNSYSIDMSKVRLPALDNKSSKNILEDIVQKYTGNKVSNRSETLISDNADSVNSPSHSSGDNTSDSGSNSDLGSINEIVINKVEARYKKINDLYRLSINISDSKDDDRDKNIDELIKRSVRGIKCYLSQYLSTGWSFHFSYGNFLRFHGETGRYRAMNYLKQFKEAEENKKTDSTQAYPELDILRQLLEDESGKTLKDCVLRSIGQYNADKIIKDIKNVIPDTLYQSRNASRKSTS